MMPLDTEKEFAMTDGTGTQSAVTNDNSGRNTGSGTEFINLQRALADANKALNAQAESITILAGVLDNTGRGTGGGANFFDPANSLAKALQAQASAVAEFTKTFADWVVANPHLKRQTEA
jgi:hypothetical protein